mmetsp:Transcript_50324/g.113068  ORF Transcript_50324/g.113068 Transcript_50324/m.113068 type:complete len:282 (+) Transcript_50324:980-1825(+)
MLQEDHQELRVAGQPGPFHSLRLRQDLVAVNELDGTCPLAILAALSVGSILDHLSDPPDGVILLDGHCCEHFAREEASCDGDGLASVLVPVPHQHQWQKVWHLLYLLCVGVHEPVENCTAEMNARLAFEVPEVPNAVSHTFQRGLEAVLPDHSYLYGEADESAVLLLFDLIACCSLPGFMELPLEVLLAILSYQFVFQLQGLRQRQPRRVSVEDSDRNVLVGCPLATVPVAPHSSYLVRQHPAVGDWAVDMAEAAHAPHVFLGGRDAPPAIQHRIQVVVGS